MDTTQAIKQQADILIVDDIPDNIRFLSSFLIEQGFTVRKAINAQVALKAIRALTPDLILLDVNMPDMNGYELCQQLKQDRATFLVPIIFLSAGNDALDKVRAFQAGGADYITKPFHLEEVLSRIQTQLTIRGLQRELEEQNEQLKQALEGLKLAQTNLVQQEKMATLRKVVAGVAHEVNNPLSFIAGNVNPIKEYIDQLLTLVRAYQQHYPDAHPTIDALLKEMDLDFLASDAMKIMSSISHGAERIQSVILALRIFTRLDESGVKQIDLHQSIDNVLALLQHRLHLPNHGLTIRIEKSYAKLPLITCYADQLNQVIFNLLCNAIDAIDEKVNALHSWSHPPQIWIATELSDDRRITVRIKDNGIGIEAANRQAVFEPFFTTKSAGQGVGLGLATSQRIIEELHSGHLTYHSIPGQETEFVIRLPIEKSPAIG